MVIDLAQCRLESGWKVEHVEIWISWIYLRLHEIKTSEFPQANFNLDMFFMFFEDFKVC